MQIYTLKEAARKTKIGMETLKRACEEGLIKATRLANGQWRIAESALEAAFFRMSCNTKRRVLSSSTISIRFLRLGLPAHKERRTNTMCNTLEACSLLITSGNTEYDFKKESRRSRKQFYIGQDVLLGIKKSSEASTSLSVGATMG
jgi:excisionase family DNA binding protein